ncbi:CHAT domain-containing protein [Xanthomonas citri]|uniref:CHAT domain-containing protein n=1 Tax=Xanthomonas citri TaxID=346 RepID=UPI001CBD843C|nr:CHAT domain-containing protein [Xanthomonas citri]
MRLVKLSKPQPLILSFKKHLDMLMPRRAQKEVSKIEEKIAAEQKKLVVTQKNIEREEARQQKQRDITATNAARAQEQRMSQIGRSLRQHDILHQQTRAELANLRVLPEKITVAFFASDPGSDKSNRLLLDEEVRAIQHNLRLSEHRDSVEFQSRWAVRPGDLFQALNEIKPTIVHFSGHGSSEDELVLQDDLGNAKFVSKQAIVQTIALVSDAARLVFFNTCFSYEQARACTEHVDAAIGMNSSIGDEAARIFAGQFYSAIGFGLSIPQAFQQAKARLLLEEIAEDTTPQLYIKEGVEEGDLILGNPPAH